jgi:hypothetical protein
MDKQFQRDFLQARILKSGPRQLSEDGLAGLLFVVLSDLGIDARPYLKDPKTPPKIGPYFATDLKLIRCVMAQPVDRILWDLRDKVPDIFPYFACLCELHKRRTKFRWIIENQPLPTMEQVVPRSLLEYGLTKADVLASWLTWRKWLYDIDNRSAQETGYVFEPIIARALGGATYSARNSPVRRIGDTRKGRQIDCLVQNDAYELKMRMTIAASGQGRWDEELAFPTDCKASGFRPVLVVFDSTPSSKLEQLVARFKGAGGLAFVGDDAWSHIRERGGKTMGEFVLRYVRTPIDAIEEAQGALLPLQVLAAGGRFRVVVGDHVIVERTVERGELVEDDNTRE